MNEEGWYVDPFGFHEARWFSDGTATALVRDGKKESTDEPPTTTVEGELTRIEGQTPIDGTDLRRSDDNDNEPSYDPNAGARAAFDIMDQIGPGVFWHTKPHRRGHT